MPVAISATGLTKKFNSFVAVDNISFEVIENEIFGFLGPNGAGKTTTVRMLTGEIALAAGKINIFGETLSFKHKHLIGVSPQQYEISEHLTAYQNLYFYGSLYGLHGTKLKKRCNELLQYFGLEDSANTLVKKFSGGMKQRLNVMISLVHDPKIVFLDEPTAGLDPQAKHKLWNIIEELKSEGKTVFLTTHYMEEADALCDRVAIIDRGKIIVEGEPQHLKDNLKKDRILEIDAKIHSKIIESIKNIDGVKNAYIRDEKIIVLTENPENILPKIVKMVENLTNIKIEKPTLEDVFLELTGRHLRE